MSPRERNIAPLPKNVKPEDSYIFRRRAEYVCPHLGVREINDVFLTHYGILLKGYFPIGRSLPNAWGFFKPNAGFIFSFVWKGLLTKLTCEFGSSLESTRLDPDKKYLLVYTPWFGYFSWITESLPRIRSVQHRHSDMVLILPEGYAQRPFVLESLTMFSDLTYEVIKDGVHMFVQSLVMPELKPFTYVFNKNSVNDFRDYVTSYVSKLRLNIESFSRIYVSRKNAKNRKIVNNDEVENIFRSSGFSIVLFEEYSFFEQVYLMMNCTILAGAHGAGFANISFMPVGSKLFELIKEYSSVREERPSYWRLAGCLGLDYYVQYCRPVNYNSYDLWVGVDLVVDLEELKKNINIII